MAHNVHVSTLGRNAMLNGVAALLNGGSINFYSGTQPANANTALSGNTLLCTLTYGSPAYGAASGGSATANMITAGVIAAGGTAAWARIFESDGTTAVIDCSVDVTGNTPDIVVPTTTFTVGVTVTMTSNTLSLAA